MKDNYEKCLAHILFFEGGYVNHPSDPGGETNMGISKRSYPKENIKGMTRERAAAIYRRDYWDAVRGDDLPAGLDLVAFDAAVNSGVSRGAKWVQSALGVKADGKIGPASLAAAKASDARRVIRTACQERMRYLQQLATWGTFGKGWAARVTKVEQTALAMLDFQEALNPAPVAPPAREVPAAGFWGSIINAVVTAIRSK